MRQSVVSWHTSSFPNITFWVTDLSLVLGCGFCFEGGVKCSSCAGVVDVSSSNSLHMITNNQDLDPENTKVRCKSCWHRTRGWEPPLCREVLSTKSTAAACWYLIAQPVLNGASNGSEFEKVFEGREEKKTSEVCTQKKKKKNRSYFQVHYIPVPHTRVSKKVWFIFHANTRFNKIFPFRVHNC